jgi:hypothetical protein
MPAPLIFALAPLAMIPFGGWIIAFPFARRMDLPGLLALSFLAGAVALTVECILFSLVGVPWSMAGLSLMPVAGTAGIVARQIRFSKSHANVKEGFGAQSRFVRVLSWIAIVGAVVALATCIIAARGNSVDLLYFWGAKAHRFALARGIDTAFLKDRFAIHTHVNYPPLLPCIYAWAEMVAGKFCWRAAPLISVLWLAAGIALIRSFLRLRGGAARAESAAAYWAVCLAASFVYSKSGGNAEAPLVVCLSVAVLVLLLEEEIGTGAPLLASLALAGAVLTKLEGSVAAVLIASGAVLRDWMAGRPLVRRVMSLAALPLICIAIWFGFEIVNGLPVVDPIRESPGQFSFAHARDIANFALPRLGVGTFGIAWILPAVFLVIYRRRWKDLLPALVPIFGLIGFIVVYYLHIQQNLEVLIIWTLPRLIQPVLSLLIIASVIAWMRSGSTGGSKC